MTESEDRWLDLHLEDSYDEQYARCGWRPATAVHPHTDKPLDPDIAEDAAIRRQDASGEAESD